VPRSQLSGSPQPPFRRLLRCLRRWFGSGK
jgi:hypothetical protein